MQSLTVSSTPIRRDAEGRYSLNDLHRASGGEAKHQPAFWLRNAQAQALVQELNNSANLQSSPVHSEEGRGGGTYVAEQLVVAYAAWISPKFHLEVINTFLAARTAQSEAVRLTLIEPEFTSACKLAERFGMQGNQVLLSASNAVKQLHGIDPKSLLGVTHLIAHQQVRHFTPTELGKRIGMSPQKFNNALRDAGLQERRDGQWCATDDGRRFSVLMDTTKRHHDGTPVTQLKWLESVMALLEHAKAA